MDDDCLKEILIRNVRLNIQAGDIHDDTDLVNDLALDSILVVNLFADLEEEFDILIDVQELTTPILSKYLYLKNYLHEKTALRTLGE